MRSLFSGWSFLMSKIQKTRLTKAKTEIKTEKQVQIGPEERVKGIPVVSETKITTSAEAPTKPHDEPIFPREAEPASVSSSDMADNYTCCDCEMDCRYGGCTAFDGMS
ncbi:hypothetical protein VTL71DRAFT_14975 [Oculimacula yallundae]|uniref:Uncharacterized protein n=1 Tax=Oculimacula yallundae TaxID=86028 RepID=A0ABR4CFD9_9HELO